MVGVDTIDAMIARPAGARTRVGVGTGMGAVIKANLLVRHTILKGDPFSS